MKTEIQNDVTVVFPDQKQVDVMNSSAFGADLIGAFDPKRDVIVDLGSVLFIDSSGLGEIVRFIRIVRERDRKVVLCGMGEAVSVLFDMVRIDQIVPLVSDVESAIARIREDTSE